MPKDSKGNFHLNSQRAAAADKNVGFKPGAAPVDPKDPPAAHGGDATPHEMLGKLHASSGGKHMHIHSHGMGHTTHHVGEDGQPGGPDEHGSDDELKQHVGNVMGDGQTDQMDDDTGHAAAQSDSDYY
jgi:hypothetical protein